MDAFEERQRRALQEGSRSRFLLLAHLVIEPAKPRDGAVDHLGGQRAAMVLRHRDRQRLDLALQLDLRRVGQADPVRRSGER